MQASLEMGVNFLSQPLGYWDYRCETLCSVPMKMKRGLEGLERWLRVLAAFVKDPSTVASTDVMRLTTTDNSSFGGSDALFWPPWINAFMCTYSNGHNIHIHVVKNKNKS